MLKISDLCILFLNYVYVESDTESVMMIFSSIERLKFDRNMCGIAKLSEKHENYSQKEHIWAVLQKMFKIDR